MTTRKDYVVSTTRGLISRTISHDDRAAVLLAIADGNRGITRRFIRSIATGGNVTLTAYDGLLTDAHVFGDTLKSEAEYNLVVEIVSEHRSEERG